MPTRSRSDGVLNLSAKTFWPKTTELVSLAFKVKPLEDCSLYPQYTIGLHSWLLDQMRQIDPKLSAYMHDSASEKSFSLTGLSGQFTSHSRELLLHRSKTYDWRVNGLSKTVVQGLVDWLRMLPDEISLKNAPLEIEQQFQIPIDRHYHSRFA